ncbi:MAG: DUF4054 domain-containing protein [Burkholderiales bacterium]
MHFPEFVAIADAVVAYWGSIAEQLVGDRFRSMRGHGIDLVTAHNLALNGQSGAGIGSTGGEGGLVQSKSVGPASITYDTGFVGIDGGGNWNETVYGRRYLNLVNLYGQGATQL